MIMLPQLAANWSRAISGTFSFSAQAFLTDEANCAFVDELKKLEQLTAKLKRALTLGLLPTTNGVVASGASVVVALVTAGAVVGATAGK